MEDKVNVSDSCKEVIGLIKSKFADLKKALDEKDKEIDDLKKALDLSESRSQTAEEMVTQIKGEVNTELQKAYNSGYNAALFNANPAGGTTVSQNEDKKLVLTQN